MGKKILWKLQPVYNYCHQYFNMCVKVVVNVAQQIHSNVLWFSSVNIKAESPDPSSSWRSLIPVIKVNISTVSILEIWQSAQIFQRALKKASKVPAFSIFFCCLAGSSGIWEPSPPSNLVRELWGCFLDIRHQAAIQPPGSVHAHRQRLAGECPSHAGSQSTIPRLTEWWVSPSFAYVRNERKIH